MTGLTDKLLIACKALAEGKSVKQAAKAANISESYLSKQKQTAEFRHQQAIFCTYNMSDLLPICIKKLKEIINLKTDKEIISSQISAIKTIFEFANIKELSEPTQKELHIKVEYVEPKQEDESNDETIDRNEILKRFNVDMEDDNG